MEERCRELAYPVGIQTFSKVREGGFVYVDKTRFVYDLTKNDGYYFLSRPRRFGKSLLLSTIEAYFSGRRDLFHGLALDSLTEDWNPHPILHLDLNSFDYSGEDNLSKALSEHLEKWEEVYGSEKQDRDLSVRFSHIIEKAYQKTGQRVVILIDEYDKPMQSAINNKTLAERFRIMLKAFYGNL